MSSVWIKHVSSKFYNIMKYLTPTHEIANERNNVDFGNVKC